MLSAVVQFNAGNPAEMRDRNPDDPAEIARAAAAAEKAAELGAEYLALEERRNAIPRHKRVLRRERRKIFGH